MLATILIVGWLAVIVVSYQIIIRVLARTGQL